jgi:hypothetical protein
VFLGEELGFKLKRQKYMFAKQLCQNLLQEIPGKIARAKSTKIQYQFFLEFFAFIAFLGVSQRGG